MKNLCKKFLVFMAGSLLIALTFLGGNYLASEMVVHSSFLSKLGALIMTAIAAYIILYILDLMDGSIQ
jgi:ABC-type uncharacterized transport system permease subunit